MSVRDIKKTFVEGGQPLHILRGGGFDLHRGEIIALVGPSGCGKSTLLQCVGLLDKPTSGSILINGAAVHKMDEDLRTNIRRTKIGFVYQKHNLLSDFTALENVVLPMLTNGVPESAAISRAAKLLRAANVAHRASHYPSEMSGGEQQRTAVARALANTPDILLADEPTGSLDPQHATTVFDLLLDLVRKNKMAMLFVTHDMNLASRADRRITIKNGIVE
ncbi:MAG: ABC transporter ATP-binding protein [Alphaproteobacteria bacterium]|nr:ABC transporter ATP-binding protein [Alphaproteobacteria bacterium]MBQ4130350.1 ABC transporter ATP-binding protein [Alphaproteobacteria bacterium]MBR5566980.1 ABC transporter ATP-binding protein [Alphaproteobacteria bacterium]